MATKQIVIPTKFEIEATDEQIKAIEALPDDVKKNLRPPRGGKLIMTDEELTALQQGAMPSTVMCPW